MHGAHVYSDMAVAQIRLSQTTWLCYGACAHKRRASVAWIRASRACSDVPLLPRYALRTSAQWLASVPETLLESVRRVETELNSTGDNPVIDDNSDAVLHCGNFQVRLTGWDGQGAGVDPEWAGWIPRWDCD